MIGTTAALIMGGMAAAGSLGGAAISAKGAKGAAATQAAAGREVAASGRQAGIESGDRVRGAAFGAADLVDQKTQAAEQGVYDASDRANNILSGVYQTAGDVTDPYRRAGAEAVGKLNGLADEKFSYDANSDPSTQFRLQEAQKALERSAASRGTLLSGGQLKALTRYSQDFASTEYGKAFDRFQTDRTNRGNILTGAAGLGSTANGQYLAAGDSYGGRVSNNITDAAKTAGAFGLQGAGMAGGFRVGGEESAGNFRMQGEQIAGNALTGAANANAAGQVGAGNAWAGAVGSASQLPMQMMMLQALTKK